MVWEALGKDARTENKRDRDKWIGVYIGVLAVFLAICGLGGGNANQDANMKNVEVTNNWAFFQAKNLRRQMYHLSADELELMLQAQPAPADATKKMIEARIADYRDYEKKLTSDSDRKEGIDELFVKGKALEAARNEAMLRGPYFDYGSALLQIAIVLASIAIISGGNALLIFSAAAAALGVVATLGGFTLAFPLPFAG